MLTFTVIGILVVISFPTLGKVVRGTSAVPVGASCEEADDGEFKEKVPVRVEDGSDRKA